MVYRKYEIISHSRFRQDMIYYFPLKLPLSIYVGKGNGETIYGVIQNNVSYIGGGMGVVATLRYHSPSEIHEDDLYRFAFCLKKQRFHPFSA